MEWDPRQLSAAQCHKLLIGTVIPRPIAFVTTISPAGGVNAAPFSFFNVVGTKPPMLAVAVGERNGQPKDTAANAMATGEFVVNVVHEEIGPAMNITGVDFPPEINELEQAGLHGQDSVRVAPPRVAEAKVQMECQLQHVLRLGEKGHVHHLLIGEIVYWHVDDDLLFDGDKVDPGRLRPIARLAGSFYTPLGEIFQMKHPSYGDDGPREDSGRGGAR